MKKIYCPGKGGAYRSLLTAEKDLLTFTPNNSISSIELEFINKLGYDSKYFTVIDEINEKEVEIEFYALDQEALKFVESLISSGIKVFYRNNVLDIERMKKMVEGAKNLRDKSKFYDYVSSVNPNLIASDCIIFENSSKLRSSKDEILNNIGLPLSSRFLS